MIGIFAGTFDPLTLGHLWVIEQAKGMFDELHVLIGRHPTKKPLLTEDERLGLLKACLEIEDDSLSLGLEGNWLGIFEQTTAGFGPATPFETIKIGVLDRTHSEYLEKIGEDSLNVKLVRGIRNSKDAEYEVAVADYNSRNFGLETVVLMPPNDLVNISSSGVKDLAKAQKWAEVEQYVPSVVAEMLKMKFNGVVEAECDKDDEYERINAFFKKLVENGLVVLPGLLTRQQVESMLDPFPYKVAVSDRYFLEDIFLDNVRPTGTRFIKRSCSLGPIIVDFNENIPDLTEVIVIEGKHRWLDARKRGEQTIKAWVGDKAINYWKKRANETRG